MPPPKKARAEKTDRSESSTRQSHSSTAGPSLHNFNVRNVMEHSTASLAALHQTQHETPDLHTIRISPEIATSQHHVPVQGSVGTSAAGTVIGGATCTVPKPTGTAEFHVQNLNPELFPPGLGQHELTDYRTPLPIFSLQQNLPYHEREMDQLMATETVDASLSHTLEKMCEHTSLWREQATSRVPPSNTRTELQCLNIQPELHDFEFLEPNQSTPEDCSDQLIYPGARISVQESVLSCIVFAQTENLKTAALCRLLGLIDIHCPKENNIPKTTHLFFKNLNKANSAFTVTYYCSLCWKDRSSSSDLCDTCESPKKRVHYYVSCDIDQQIAELYQRSDFVEAIQHKTYRSKRNFNNIEDIYDGCIYKEAQRSVLTDPYNISLMWYTDGIQLYESSTYSLWPFYFVVNELPLHLRFRPENIIIAGFWGSSTHPHPNIFLREILVNIEKLKQGIDVDIVGLNEKRTVKVFVLCGVGDSPAKSCFMNIKSHSGFFACPKCLIEGKNSKQTSNVTVFPFQEILQTRPSSQSQEYKNQVKESMRTLDDCQGVKGPTLLSYMLQDTCMFESTAIDAMHSVYMGCLKQILNLITNSKFSKLPFSISKHVNAINILLNNLSLPYFVQRLPVQIDKLYLWKASLLRNFFYYIMLPLLKIFMSDLYFQHLTLLVEAIYYLNRPSISMNDVTKAEDLLRQFVQEFETLYGVRNMSMNVHLLLHLPDNVRQLGPLFVTACYGFEDLNGKLGNLAHGTKDASMQIAKRLNFFTDLPKIIRNMPPSISKDFCEKVTCNWKRFHMEEAISSTMFVVGYYDETLQQSNEFSHILSNFYSVPYNCKTFCKLYKDQQLFVASTYKRSARNSSFVKYSCRDGNVLGEILTFVKVSTSLNDEHYFACIKRRAVQSFLPDGRLDYISKDMGDVCTDLVPVHNLVTVCFKIDVSENVYLCEPVNPYELE